MIVVNAMDLVALALLVVCVAAITLVFIAERIAAAIRRRQQQRIDEAYKDGEP